MLPWREPVMAELVGEREPLALWRLRAVDEQQRAPGADQVRAGDAGAEVQQHDVRPAEILDRVEQIRQRAVRTQPEVLPRLPRPLEPAVGVHAGHATSIGPVEKPVNRELSDAGRRARLEG